MPRVEHIKRARKPNPVVSQEDIDAAKADDQGQASYYKWSFRYGPTRYSKTYPRQSQLTQSEYLSGVYELQEEIADAGPYESADDLEAARDDWASRARDLGSECQDKFDNMPEGLQQGDTGQLLEERAQAMEQWADDLEGVDISEGDVECDEDATEEARAEALETYLGEKLEELQGLEPEVN